MLKYTQILNKVKSGDRVIIRDYINSWIVADDTVENLLDISKYNQDSDIYRVGVENGCLLLEICE